MVSVSAQSGPVKVCLADPAMPEKSEAGLPAGWEVRHSNSKNLPYFFNAATKESRWEYPANTDTEKLKAYMEQNHSASVESQAGGGGGRGTGRDGKIRAAHLLVKHRDSRRPSSWRETDITRTKEEAIAILEGYEKRIRNGEISLGDLALTESDCTSARKRGDLSVPFVVETPSIRVCSL